MVLRRCVRDSIDLQKGMLECIEWNESTTPVRPRHTPLASSTPYGMACSQPTAESRPESALPEPEPMQVDPTGLSLSEHHGRLTLGLCLYCGPSGHPIISCPICPPPPHLNF